MPPVDSCSLQGRFHAAHHRLLFPTAHCALRPGDITAGGVERPQSTGSKVMFSLSSVVLFGITDMLGVDSCVFLIFTTRFGLKTRLNGRRGYPVFDPSALLSVLYRTILSQSIFALKRPSIGKPFFTTFPSKHACAETGLGPRHFDELGFSLLPHVLGPKYE